MLTEARCCGDDLVDENQASLPDDAVRRFDTAVSALKLRRCFAARFEVDRDACVVLLFYDVVLITVFEVLAILAPTEEHPQLFA